MTIQVEAAPVLASSEVTILASGFEFIEGPVWQAETSRLLFNDIPGNTAYSWSAGEGVSVLRHPSHKANGQVIDTEGRVVVCEHLTNSVVILELEGSRQVLVHDYQGQELNSPNDVIMGADGSLLFTDPPFGRIEAPMAAIRPTEIGFCGGSQWRQDKGILLLTTRLTQPNGLCLSIDQARLYVNDTANGDIVEFATSWRDAGLQLDEGHVLARVPQDRAGADGLKIDARGNIWCTGSEGLYVFDCCGKQLDVVELEEPAANFAWGGVDGRDLYIASRTTMRHVRTTVAGAAWV